MKTFLIENRADYSKYQFNYNLFCIQETVEEIPEIYDSGYLPYSDHQVLQHLEKPVFYMARSVRIRLENFNLTSENKRIRKRIGSVLKPSVSILNKTDLSKKEILDFAYAYAQKRMKGAMPYERLEFIWNHPLLNKVYRFDNQDDTIAYVWTNEHRDMIHYWFSFYDLKYFQLGLGKWIMEQVISLAKEMGKKYIYLGTCYGQKSAYKIRDFRGIEFFDGNTWSTDIKKLKTKCKQDENGETDKHDFEFLR